MKKAKILFNNMRALKNYHQRRIKLSNPPSFIWLEPTNHCNLKCIMCPNGTDMVNVQKGYMEYKLYKNIIDEIKDYASSITLAVSGESMMHSKFFDMIKYASGNGIKVLLNTNATLLNREKADLLLESGISSVSFAFDGFNKEMYEKARVGSHFDKTLENILYFLESRKRKKLKLPYTVLSVLMLEIGNYTEEEKCSFLKRFHNLIDEVRLREVSTWGSTFKDTDEFSFRTHNGFFAPCSRIWSTTCIMWNGDVVPCIYNANHEYVLGNIKDEGLLDIWNNQKMVQLRKAMLERTYLDISPLCDNCIVLGTPTMLGIPSGIRLTLTDAVTNIIGYNFEKFALYFANKLKRGKFSSIPLN